MALFFGGLFAVIVVVGGIAFVMRRKQINKFDPDARPRRA
jgi:nitrate reductase gamma subunit